MNKSIVERFERHIEYIPESGCHWWIAGVCKDGYGKFKAHGCMQKAHRFAYLAYVGRIPTGIMVLHTCDNPSCVNPEHLFLGTAMDNARDRDKKHRGGSAKGIINSGAKLCDEDIVGIRKKRNLGCSLKEIAKEYGVREPTISVIANRKAWRHVK